MARVFTDGAEMGDILFWDGGGTPTVDTATPDPYPGSGTYYYQLYNGAYAQRNISASTEFYFRFRAQWSANTSTSMRLEFRNTGCSDVESYLRFNASAKLEAGRGNPASSTILAMSTNAFSINTWYLVEIYLKHADVGGRFVLKVDGNTEFDYTGDTKNSCASINYIRFSTPIGHYWYIDDLGMNDTSGGTDDSWLGNGQIVSVYPNANGTTNDWTGSDADSTDNYLLVDEVPNDGDTTYVYEDGTASGSQDQYGLSDYDGTNKVINRIYVEARAKKTSADAATLKLGILPSGGVDDMSAGRDITTIYTRVVGDEYTLNPDDSAAWEEADIDALELVLEIG